MQASASVKKKFKNLLFIDVKTVAAEASFDQVHPRLQQQWEQKIRYYRDDEGMSPAEWYDRRASYYAEFGRIVCVGIGGLYWNDEEQLHLKVKILDHDNELSLLREFIHIINRYSPNDLVLCAHNGKEFDYPFLCRRMMVHGFKLPQTLQLSGRKPWEVPHQDTLENWRFGERSHFVPLDLLAAILDVPAKPLDLTEEQVNLVYYGENDMNRIRQYTQDSIVMLTQVYLRMTGAPLLEENHIIYTD
ncbi:3'-5' exonuclease [Nibrella saemangeumensis]|uniref:3'-5' exonuclease n=1 Tax=Nibrella saemangeumensis TaxID=1084526 RepID=A0ABP8MGA1_9BACT